MTSPSRSPNVKQLDSHGTPDRSTSSDDDHFSDASEGKSENEATSRVLRKTPKIPVDLVDSQLSYGDTSSRAAHSEKGEEVLPDETIIDQKDNIPQPSRYSDHIVGPPSQPPIPKTVVEKIDPDVPSFGEIPGTDAFATREADAQPDEVMQAPAITSATLEESPTSPPHRYSIRQPTHVELSTNVDGCNDAEAKQVWTEDGRGASLEDDDDVFGDDFDDFEVGNTEDDFGAFDEVPQASFSTVETSSIPPLLDFNGLDNVEDIVAACHPYILQIFPHLKNHENSVKDDLPEANGSLLTERSQSLWSQLIAPPPLAPPDWIRSRIRRLFLVSLGVPIDLDEILPASKQKKLILPSVEVGSLDSQPSNPDGRRSSTATRLRQGNHSSTSVNSNGSRSERRRKGPPPPPEFDINSARLLCSTTTMALENFTDDELKSHVALLDKLKQTAGEVLEYWLLRKDSATGEKDAFEEVIENLVKHAKKIRR